VRGVIQRDRYSSVGCDTATPVFQCGVYSMKEMSQKCRIVSRSSLAPLWVEPPCPGYPSSSSYACVARSRSASTLFIEVFLFKGNAFPVRITFWKTPLLPPLKKSPSDWYALPRFAYDPPSPARSPNSLAIARFCVWYSIALPKSSSDWYAFPRFPYALPSPARSPLPPQKIPLPGLHGKRPGPCVTVPHPSHANRDKVAGGRQWGELCVLMTLPRRPVTRSVT
jgi:hypothetical protein